MTAIWWLVFLIFLQEKVFACIVPAKWCHQWLITLCCRLYDGADSWQLANSSCVQEGAQMVSVHNTAENAFLLLLLDGATGWLGLNLDLQVGEWQHEPFPVNTKHLYNIYTTLVRRCINVIQMLCVYWVGPMSFQFCWQIREHWKRYWNNMHLIYEYRITSNAFLRSGKMSQFRRRLFLSPWSLDHLNSRDSD